MAESTSFTTLCDALESASSLDRLAARGTVRIALKQAGLEASSATRDQLLVVVDRILPAELRSRGIDQDLSAPLRAALEALADDAGATDTPEAVFQRLGG